MTFRFAGFELDEAARELRLNGDTIFLQPRVFDLLVHLLQNRDRVVGKEELLDALWPGIIVTESSLQRAMSLARSALRQGGLESAIRTFSRQGYRFCEEVTVVVHDDVPTGGPDAALARARQSHERGAWDEAVAEFRQADREEDGLEAVDLDRWAYAAQCTGHLADAVAPLERAVAAHSAGGNRQGAARSALFLSHVLVEQRELAVAEGWQRRAASLLADAPVSAEHGLAQVMACRFAMAGEDMERAVQHAEAAYALGQQIADPDVEALALVYRGHALLSLGEVQRATPLIDESAAAVLAGQVSPLIGGLIYCGVIWAYRNIADWQRADQWSGHFTRWCERSGLSTFSGSCRLHRAEVLSLRGEFDAAERAIQEACRFLPINSGRTEGEAYRILGDLRLVRGDLDGADEAFRRAHELGFDPQPGLALLMVARGQQDTAIRSLERALDDHRWSSRQRRGLLLAHLITLAAGADQPEVARGALAELETEHEAWSTPALLALRARAGAEVAFAEGRIRAAITELRRAVGIWQEIGSPLNVAELRFRLAELLFTDNDPHAAELELSAAESAFHRLDAPLQSERCKELRGKLVPVPGTES